MKQKKATLKDFCKAPIGVCNSVGYDCSKCPSINQINALDELYGKEKSIK